MESVTRSELKHKRSRSAAAFRALISPSKQDRPATKPLDKPSGHRHKPPEVRSRTVRQENNDSTLLDISNDVTRLPSAQKEGETKDCSRIYPSHSPLKSSGSIPNNIVESLDHGGKCYLLADKENASPSALTHDSGTSLAATPIWAQFTSQTFHDQNFSAPQSGHSNSKTSSHITGGVRKGQDKMALSLKGGLSHTDNTEHLVPAPSYSTKQPAREAQQNNSTPVDAPKRSSRVINAVAMWNNKAKVAQPDHAMSDSELNEAFERVLARRNIPEAMRQNMRTLDTRIKRDFIRHGGAEREESQQQDKTSRSFWTSKRTDLKPSAKTATEEYLAGESTKNPSPLKRGRSRSRTFTIKKEDRSPSKRARSNSRPRPLMLLKNLSSTSINSFHSDSVRDSTESNATPEVFVEYLRTESRPDKVEVGRVHKLRILLRSGSIGWTEEFISKGGMTELISLLRRTIAIEWREEHEDMVMHETLLCLKGLSTTEKAQQELERTGPTLFPELLRMLFDEERRGPSEFNTRGIITSILFMHLASAPAAAKTGRARQILRYLSDPQSSDEEEPADFILSMRTRRPYVLWNKEVLSVGKEVFWIFLHHVNVIALSGTGLAAGNDYMERHFPRERPPVPAAPYVGGVEWEATQYLTSHLDLINGLIASLSTVGERNQLRQDLRLSGFEKTMGETLRTCKEKFYGYVHDALRVWIVAGMEDQWETADVRMGQSKREEPQSPMKSPRKPQQEAPQLELPKLQIANGPAQDSDDGWL